MTGFGRMLAALNAREVAYVVVGGIAVIRHGVVRATRDLDAIIAGDPANLDAVRSLVSEWKATRPDGSPVPADAFGPGRDLHLLTPDGEVDLLAELPSPLSFAELIDRSDRRKVDGVEAPIVSLGDLVALKRRAGRGRDLEDLRALGEAHGELPETH